MTPFVVFLLLGLLASKSAAAIGMDVPHGPLNGSGLSFAIADFDGDGVPDLATVESERIGSYFTDYWVEVQCSALGWKTIRLVAPTGGLRIKALDLDNGDHFIDLVFTTGSRQPVAILLNDGHGGFSRIKPAAFPEAFTDSTATWVSCSGQALDAAAVSAQPRSQIWSSDEASLDVRPHADSTLALTSRFFLRSFLFARASRAPPLELSHF